MEKVDPNLLLALLNVTHEAELQREIRDIIDELDIILHIAKQQQEMIKRFVKFALEIIDPDASRHKAASPYDETHSEQYTAFTTHSEDLLSEIKDRITELSGLKSSAESTAQNVSVLFHAVNPAPLEVAGTITDRIPGQRSARPQTATSECRTGL